MEVISAIHQVSVLRNRSRLAGLPILPDEIWIHQILPYLFAVEKRSILANLSRSLRLKYCWSGGMLLLSGPVYLRVFAHYRDMTYYKLRRPIHNIARKSVAYLPENYTFTGVPEWAREEYLLKAK